MASSENKYISTKDAVRLTGLSPQEIYDLIHTGTLPARKAPKSGWRISPKDLATLGLIQNESDSIVEEQQTVHERYSKFHHYLLVW